MEEADLRRFAQQGFFESGLGRSLHLENERVLTLWRYLIETDVTEEIFPLPVDRLLRSAGAFVEGWASLTLGLGIGYFEQAISLPEIDRVMIGRAASYEGEGQWPPFLRQFAQRLASGDIPTPPEWEIPYGDAEALATFQAAMIVADGFSDPLIAGLQWSLQAENSILDGERGEVSGSEVFDAIRTHGESLNDLLELKQSWASSVAGFLQLSDLLAAFENIFPGDLRREDWVSRPRDGKSHYEWEEVVEPEDLTRFTMGRAVTNILAWRLNLWDERTFRRLEAVSNVFWELSQREFRQNQSTGIQWSASGSREEWEMMLVRWEERVRPERNVARLRYVGDSAEIENQPRKEDAEQRREES